MRKFWLYWHTIRFLRWEQIFHRVFYKLLPARLPKTQSLAFSEPTATWQRPVTKSNSFVAPATLTFLNQSHTINHEKDWNHPGLPKLWLYHLHYFDYLNSTNVEQYGDSLKHLIQRWVNENPPLKGNGWEPYPVSLRLVNWCQWLLAGKSLPIDAIASLSQQAEFLYHRLEKHLLGNHLLANSKALVFVGCCFQGDLAQRCYQRGVKLLEQQLAEQVLPDGGHFELSPMYHALILEDVLDLINLCQAYQKPLVDELKQTAESMLTWLAVMTHEAGMPAFFNDSTGKVAPKLANLLDYAKRLNVTFNKPANQIDLPQSGYVRLKNDRFNLLMDAAPVGADYIPGHAHADTLSFELACKGQRIFINSGISTYQNLPLRQRQRSSAAHNCLVIDQTDSSEVWGAFRVARRAQVIKRLVDLESSRVTASHNGYEQLLGQQLQHQRQWQLEEKRVVISDKVAGSGQHDLTLYFHLHPLVQVEQIAPHEFSLRLPEAGEQFIFKISSVGEASVEPDCYYPEFGKSQLSQCIVVTVQQTQLPCYITSYLSIEG